MFLFGRSNRSPQELVKGLKELLTALEKGDKKYEKVNFLLYSVILLLMMIIID